MLEDRAFPVPRGKNAPGPDCRRKPDAHRPRAAPVLVAKRFFLLGRQVAQHKIIRTARRRAPESARERSAVRVCLVQMQ